MSAFPLTSSATWSAWVYPTGTPGDDGQIIAKSGNSDGWQLKTTPDTGRRTFGVAVSNGSSNVQRYSATQISLNTWYYVAGVYNAGSQTLDIYVNGVLDNGTLDRHCTLSQNNPGSINVNIGRRQGGFYFIGTIDDVRVYNRALSPAEIQADMNTAVGTGVTVPLVTLSSTTASFGNQSTGTTSPPQTVTLTNSGSQPLIDQQYHGHRQQQRRFLPNERLPGHRSTGGEPAPSASYFSQPPREPGVLPWRSPIMLPAVRSRFL